MRDIDKGTYNGEHTWCTVNAYGECPYCDQVGICHIDDPMTDCDDFNIIFNGSWDEWMMVEDVVPESPDDFSEDEIEWAAKVYGYPRS